jgi:hypothetical protein
LAAGASNTQLAFAAIFLNAEPLVATSHCKRKTLSYPPW